MGHLAESVAHLGESSQVGHQYDVTVLLNGLWDR